MRIRTGFVATAFALTAAPAFAQTSGSNESLDLDVSVDVVEACDIALTSDVEFSEITATSGVTATATTNGVISLTCTVDTSYALAFDEGANYDTVNSIRRMSDGEASPTYLTYSLLDSGGTEIAKDETVTGVASGEAQAISVGAQLSSTNGNVPAGSYSDTITVTVTVVT